MNIKWDAISSLSSLAASPSPPGWSRAHARPHNRPGGEGLAARLVFSSLYNYVQFHSCGLQSLGVNLGCNCGRNTS